MKEIDEVIEKHGARLKDLPPERIHFAWYNFGRIHRSLRVTPAMEAGLTDHVWEMAELLYVGGGD
jgi:hypothetical protein